jgi:putative ABC transport system permease protein
MQHLRLAFRQLVKHPGFTVVAVFTLALGLGANATILGIIDAFFFRPLAVPGADRFVFVLQQTDVVEFPHGYSWLDYEDLREKVEPFEDTLALFLSPVHIGAPGRPPERTWIECVSPNYFSLLGVDAARGTVFSRADVAKPGAPPVVVLAQSFWERSFGGDPSLIGGTLHLNGQPFTLLGVMPDTFNGAQWSIAPSGWVPATALPHLQGDGQQLLDNRGAPAFKVLARLKPGATVAQARAATEVVVRQLAGQYPQDHRQPEVRIIPERLSRPEPSFSAFMPLAATVFMSLVLLVLLIACANVANLMFARALSRRKEMGVRTALGASRWQLVRQLLWESVLLALVAGCLGSLLAHGLGFALNHFMPGGDIPVNADTRWSWRVFFGTAALAVVAGVITGWVPALRATRWDLHTVLKEGAVSQAGAGGHPFRSALVIGQIALSVVVLGCGGLFLESLRRTAKLDLGFRPDHLIMASVDLGLQRYDPTRGHQFHRALTDRLASLHGVQAVALAGAVPFDYSIRMHEVGAADQTQTGPSQDGFLAAGYSAVTASYLRTLGVTLIQGRDFATTDLPDSPKVVIVNQTLARRIWGDENPLGKRLRLGHGDDVREIIGVARDGKYLMLGEDPRPYFYVPLTQFYSSPVTLFARTQGDPLVLVPALRQVLAELDPHLPIYNVRTMEEHLRQSALALMPLRLAAVLAGAQGMLGLFLAALGIYGVVSYAVTQRTHEIGIRMALGAARSDILRLVVREGWRLTLLGLGIGLALTLVVALGLSRLLYGLNPIHLPVFGAVAVVLAGVALLACYLPARRATRLNPMLALHYE